MTPKPTNLAGMPGLDELVAAGIGFTKTGFDPLGLYEFSWDELENPSCADHKLTATTRAVAYFNEKYNKADCLELREDYACYCDAWAAAVPWPEATK